MKTKKKPEIIDVSIINPYESREVQKHMTKSINPFKKFHNISVPFRGCLIGSSGSGKTATFLNICSVMSKTFNHIYIYTRAREPLYDYLREQLDDTLLTISYDLNDLRQFPEENYYGQSLVVIDDFCNEPNQQCIQELYIRGRKIAGGVSLLYLTQSYFKVPKLIRLQLNYIFILKVSGVRDLKMILSEYSLGASKEQLTKMYEYACNISGVFGHFLLIDLQAEQSKTYRKNFDEILNPSTFIK